MNGVDVLALLALPLAAAGLWLAYEANKLEAGHRFRMTLSILGLALIAGPTVLLFRFFRRHSEIELAVEYSFIATFGVVAIARSLIGKPKLAIRIGAMLLGIVALVWGSSGLADVLVLPRTQVAGVVTGAWYGKEREGCGRFCSDYFIFLQSRRYPATADVVEASRDGRRYRLGLGYFSGRALSIEEEH